MNITELSRHTDILPWHQSIWQKLQQRYPNIGHGLLFYGKHGCGKQQFAVQFAKWLLCTDKQPQGACGLCHSCRWIAVGTHPNLKLIEAKSAKKDDKKEDKKDKAEDYEQASEEEHSGKNKSKNNPNIPIRIEQVREIAEFIQQTVDGWRVIILTPAENLNIAAANALLKTLEEPGERVVIILLSHAMLRLPATIRSRVQQYALDRVLPEQAQIYLQQYLPEVDAEQQNIVLNLAVNMPLQALHIYQSAWFRQRHALLKDWLKLVQQKRTPMTFSVYWLKQLDLQDILFIVQYTVQDCIAFKLQQPIKQSDLPIAELQSHYSLQQLFDIMQQCNRIVIMLAQNVQAQLIFDDLSIRLMNAHHNVMPHSGEQRS